MSSILKALEKVETDLARQNQHQDGTPFLRPIHTGSSTGTLNKRRLPKRWLWMTGAALLVAAAGFFAANRSGWIQPQRPEPRLSESDNAVQNEEKPTAAATSRPGTPVEKPPPAVATATSGNSGTAALPRETRPKASASAASPQERQPGTARPSQPQESIDGPAAGPGDMASFDGRQRPDAGAASPEDDMRPETDTPVPPPADNSGVGGTESASPALPLLSVADLKLHAIAWSPDPAQRMAVINNSIIREGETVDGFSIVRIAQDEIVISDGREQWRLMLR